MLRRFLVLLASPAALLACSGAAGGGDLVTTPDTNTIAPQRFVVDTLAYPERPSDFAVDLNGDGLRDNQLASVLTVFEAYQTDPRRDAARMLGEGTLAPAIDLASADGAVRVRWIEGALATTVDGTFGRNAFTAPPAYARASDLGGSVRIPIFADSDPIVLPIVGAEVALRVEADGGVSGSLHGAVREADLHATVLPELHRAFTQMITRHPDTHAYYVKLIDRDADGTVTLDEFAASPLVRPFLQLDVQLYDASGRWSPNKKNEHPDALSIGFGFHAKKAK